ACRSPDRRRPCTRSRTPTRGIRRWCGRCRPRTRCSPSPGGAGRARRRTAVRAWRWSWRASGGGEHPVGCRGCELVEERGQLLEHELQRRSGEEDRLVLRDVVVEGAHLSEVPLPDLGVAEDLDLAVARAQPGAV